MWCKRLCLFIGVNLLVLLSVSVVVDILPICSKISYRGLLSYCFVWGMLGSLISLALSKHLAKLLMGVKLIDPQTAVGEEFHIMEMTYRLAEKAGLKVMPEIGIFDSSEVNAFATGPSRNNSLVALSSGAIDLLSDGELSAVIGHELTHIANGDMVTMTLLQGIVNTFVMFFARIVALFITRQGTKNKQGVFSSIIYILLVWALECIFMILGSIVICFFSRRREYRADAGGAKLAGNDNMIQVLQFLQRHQEIKKSECPAAYDPIESPQPAFNAFKISNSEKFLNIFCTHPPLEVRIQRLQKKSHTINTEVI